VGRFYPTFRNLCSERRLSGRGLSLKVCGQLARVRHTLQAAESRARAPPWHALCP
jgi:hypothetical protein